MGCGHPGQAELSRQLFLGRFFVACLRQSQGSGVATLELPDSPAVPKASAASTLTAPYNNLEVVKKMFEDNKDEIAAVILEPVVGNARYIPPTIKFLKSLREITRKNGALLVFDEVMTGFRISYGGAQEYFGVTPDLTTMGKIIGGGLPVGAYGGFTSLAHSEEDIAYTIDVAKEVFKTL
ncbi:unnamed protein product [Calypogeia fissa]